MNFKNTVTAQLEFLKRQQTLCEKKLRMLPQQGSLVKKRSRGKDYYYLDDGFQRISLIDDPALYQSLQDKKTLTQQLRSLQYDIPLLQRVVKNYQPILPLESDWHRFTAEQNTGWKQEKKHLYKGTFYRSKSETLIAAILSSYELIFKYEAAYEAGGFRHYPDFLVERPRDKKLFLWEHFGMIADEEYNKKMFFTLQDYHKAGVNLWDNLIITFDQPDGSIDTDYIDRIIKLYLL